MAKFKEEKSWLSFPGNSEGIDDSRFAENGAGITQRVHDIQARARQIDQVANNLMAVGMELPARQLFAMTQDIRDLCEPIPKIVLKELDSSIAHGKHMMGGLLAVALKMGEKDGQIHELETKLQDTSH
jgi:hypothetical protein